MVVDKSNSQRSVVLLIRNVFVGRLENIVRMMLLELLVMVVHQVNTTDRRSSLGTVVQHILPEAIHHTDVSIIGN